jgi:uncharacterized protein
LNASTAKQIYSISAVFSGSGLPRQFFDAANAGLFDLYTSEVLIAELLEVLTRDKHAKRMAKANFTAAEFINDFRRIAAVVATTLNPPRVVPTDADDDHVVSAAVAANADFIVSGDKNDLLSMRSVSGIPIVSSREALQRVLAGVN